MEEELLKRLLLHWLLEWVLPHRVVEVHDAEPRRTV